MAACWNAVTWHPLSRVAIHIGKIRAAECLMTSTHKNTSRHISGHTATYLYLTPRLGHGAEATTLIITQQEWDHRTSRLQVYPMNNFTGHSGSVLNYYMIGRYVGIVDTHLDRLSIYL